MRPLRACLLIVAMGFAAAAEPDNSPDPRVNLALLSSASLSGSVVAGGRGEPRDICFDPIIGGYAMTAHNEYGVGFQQNLGRPGEGDPFFWQAAWATPKRINHVTVGGAYPNQPQPATRWRVRYRTDGAWRTLAEGRGGWIDGGIFTWGGPGHAPISADTLRVEAFSDGANDLVSIHLRARGGRSHHGDDTGQATKACLVQYLPAAKP